MFKKIQKVFTSNIFLTAFLVILGFICYLNILPNELFYDDEELIYKNVYVKNLKNFPKYFTSNMVEGAGKSSNMYRPILLTSFALNYKIWGANPQGYHLTSILLHLSNGVLLYILLQKIFRVKFFSFFTSLLFLIHPVQTEAVAYASGRTDLLFTFFSLLSIYFALNFIFFVKNNYLHFFLTIIFFLLSLLSKEVAIIVPFLIILCTNLNKNVKRGVQHFNKLILLSLTLFLINFIYIIFRLTILNFENTLNFYNQANIYSQNIFVRFFTFTKVFFEYIKIVLFPKELIFARNIEPVLSFFSRSVIAFFILIIIISLVVLKQKKKNSYFIFCLFWFFLTIFPVSGIIPINSIIKEHYLYLPSTSFFLLISYIVFQLWQKSSTFGRHIIVISICLVLFLLSIRTIQRNYDWKDPITFYSKSLIQSPWHIPMHHNLAMTYSEKGMRQKAIEEYQKIIEKNDVYPNTHHNLANVYKDLGKYNQAEEEYIKALQIDPSFHFSYYGLLDLYQKTGETQKYQQILLKLNLKQ